MNEPTFERLLEAFVDDGLLSVDPRVVERALAEVHTTPQRRRSVAPLRRVIMQLRLVPVLTILATLLALTLVGGVALTNLEPGPTTGPTPSPSQSYFPGNSEPTPFVSTKFRVPIRLELPNYGEGPIDPQDVMLGKVPWVIDDQPWLLSITAPEPDTDRLTIMRRADARLIGDAGEIPWPGDIAAWLTTQQGVSPMTANQGLPSDSPLQSGVMFGLDPTARSVGRTIIGTAEGDALALSGGPSTILVMELSDGLSEPLIVVISGAQSAWDSWLGSMNEIVASIEGA
jgi:hypothetical protein